MSLFLQCGQGAMLKKLGRLFETPGEEPPEPAPASVAVAATMVLPCVAAQKLSKQLIKANDETAWASLIMALGDDSTFQMLVRREANAGRYQLAEQLLALVPIEETPASPTKKEVSPAELKLALDAELTALAALAGGAAAAPPPPPKGEPLSKSLIKLGGDKAAAAVQAALPAVRTYAQKSLELKLGQLRAAQRLAGSFKLSSPFPTEKELEVAIQAELVDATPKATKAELTKALLKKGGVSALNAILRAFAGDATFEALARKNSAEQLAAFVARSDQPWASVAEAEAQLEREIATKLVAAFKLAAPSPTAAECKVALTAELEELSADDLRID